MIAVMLLMFVAGIGLSQAVSDPRQVTLRWLRLGGLIALALNACAAVAAIFAFEDQLETLPLAPFVFIVPQLIAAQLGWRTSQRFSALVYFGVAAACAWLLLHFSMSAVAGKYEGRSVLDAVRLPSMFSITLSAGLLGGFLMTMLLGHAYLTAGGEMTQKPFARLVNMLALLLLLRAAGSAAFGLWPFFAADSYPRSEGLSGMWNVVMITARCLVGLVVPGIFTYMIYDCVRRRANQSATGILYVAGVMVIIGEGAALALLKATGLVF